MKTLEIEKVDDIGSEGITTEPYWPYGTDIRLNEDMLSELALSDAKVGDKFQFSGNFIVTAISSYEDEDGEGDLTITFQATNLSVDDGESSDRSDRSEVLYGDS